MKTKLNAGYQTLQSRALAYLVIRNGGKLKLSKEELSNIKALTLEVASGMEKSNLQQNLNILNAEEVNSL